MPLIEPGANVPTFKLPDHTGRITSIPRANGRWLVLFFFPKANTSACTSEACQFQALLDAFNDAGCDVVGLAPDPVQALAEMAGANTLGYPLLSDSGVGGEPPAICQKLGVWGEKSMYGNTYMGVIRTTYLIDPKGIVAQRWDRVSTPKHAAKVLKALHEALGLSKASRATPPASKKASGKRGAS
jgi:peroxiredoxin Q/BCP